MVLKHLNFFLRNETWGLAGYQARRSLREGAGLPSLWRVELVLGIQMKTPHNPQKKPCPYMSVFGLPDGPQ